MKCSQAKSLFSPYLDGAVSGVQMRLLTEHLDGCTGCRAQYVSLRQTQELLAGIGRQKAPGDLAFKLRLAISREAARSRRPYFEGLGIRLSNAINAFAVPATAGLLSAVVMFGFLMGFFATPLRAGNSDVPLMLNTAPEL